MMLPSQQMASIVPMSYPEAIRVCVFVCVSMCGCTQCMSCFLLPLIYQLESATAIIESQANTRVHEEYLVDTNVPVTESRLCFPSARVALRKNLRSNILQDCQQ